MGGSPDRVSGHHGGKAAKSGETVTAESSGPAFRAQLRRDNEDDDVIEAAPSQGTVSRRALPSETVRSALPPTASQYQGFPSHRPVASRDVEAGAAPTVSEIEVKLTKWSIEAQRHARFPHNKPGLVAVFNNNKPSAMGEGPLAKDISREDVIAFLRAVGITEEEHRHHDITNFVSMWHAQFGKIVSSALNYIAIPEIGLAGKDLPHHMNVVFPFLISTFVALPLGIAISAGYQTTGVAAGGDYRAKETFVVKLPDNISDEVVAEEQAGVVMAAAGDIINKSARLGGELEKAIAGVSNLNEEQIRGANLDDLKYLLNTIDPAALKRLQLASRDFADAVKGVASEGGTLRMAQSVQNRHVTSNFWSTPVRATRGFPSAVGAGFVKRDEDVLKKPAYAPFEKMGIVDARKETDIVEGGYAFNAFLSIIAGCMGEFSKHEHEVKEMIASPERLLTPAGYEMHLQGQDIDESHIVDEAFPDRFQWLHSTVKKEALGGIDKQITALKAEIEGLPEKSKASEATPLDEKITLAERVRALVSDNKFDEAQTLSPEVMKAFVEPMLRETKPILKRYFDPESDLSKDLAKKRKVQEGETFSREFWGQAAQLASQALQGPVVTGNWFASLTSRTYNAPFGGVTKSHPLGSEGMALVSLMFGIFYAMAIPRLIQIKNKPRAEIKKLEDNAVAEQNRRTENGDPMSAQELAEQRKGLNKQASALLRQQFYTGVMDVSKPLVRKIKGQVSPEVAAKEGLSNLAARWNDDFDFASRVLAVLGQPSTEEQLSEDEEVADPRPEGGQAAFSSAPAQPQNSAAEPPTSESLTPEAMMDLREQALREGIEDSLALAKSLAGTDGLGSENDPQGEVFELSERNTGAPSGSAQSRFRQYDPEMS